jgi:hypothetical protein
MTKTRNGRPTYILVGLCGLAVLTACNGGASKGGSTAAPAVSATSASTAAPDPTTTQTTAAPKSVDPNGPEVNEAGDIPDNQVFVPYTPPAGRFTVKVPEGWARSESGGTVVFTDKLNSVKLETAAAPSAPTVASVTDTEQPAIRAASSHFEAGAVKVVTRRSGSAVLATYRADAPPNPVTGKVVHDEVERYEFWQGGTTVIVTLSGPQGADNVDPWRIVTDSFQWR